MNKEIWTSTTMKEVALEALTTEAAEHRRDDRTLTPEARMTDFLKTAEGAELYSIYRDPDAQLSVEKYVAKKRRTKRLHAAGYENESHLLMAIAKRLAPPEDPVRWLYSQPALLSILEATRRAS